MIKEHQNLQLFLLQTVLQPTVYEFRMDKPHVNGNMSRPVFAHFGWNVNS